MSHSGWAAFWGWVKRVWNPMRWARNIILICLYALDATNLYRFVFTMMSAKARSEPAAYFGFTFPTTVAIFDSTAYALFITLTLYFMSNTLAHRLADRYRSIHYWAALVVGVGISALANAGAMFLDVTDVTLPAEIGAWGPPLALALGAVVTFGLLFYVVMDSWDIFQKKEDARKREGLDALKQLREEPAYKHSPNQHKAKKEADVIKQYGLGQRVVQPIARPVGSVARNKQTVNA